MTSPWNKQPKPPLGFPISRDTVLTAASLLNKEGVTEWAPVPKPAPTQPES